MGNMGQIVLSAACLTCMTSLTYLTSSFRPQKYGLDAKIPARNENKKQAGAGCYLYV
jgi:hypothetical protein